MEDAQIIALYFQRKEEALSATEKSTTATVFPLPITSCEIRKMQGKP